MLWIDALRFEKLKKNWRIVVYLKIRIYTLQIAVNCVNLFDT